MSEFTGPEGPIRDVANGMTVVDATGETVGIVDEIRMSDASAITSAGQTPPGGGNPFAWVAKRSELRIGSACNSL